MKSKLRTTVEKFLAENKHPALDPKIEISTREEAEELCLLLKENLHRPKHAAKLLRAFQPKEVNDEVIEVLRTEGTPLLLELEPKIEGGTGGLTNDRLFLLKLLAMYGTAEGADRVVSVAKAGYGDLPHLFEIETDSLEHEDEEQGS